MPTKKRDNSIEINRIRVVLAEKKVAQKELAAKVGITPQSVTRMCNNKTQPSLHLLREIAIALDVDITELLVHTKGKSY